SALLAVRRLVLCIGTRPRSLEAGFPHGTGQASEISLLFDNVEIIAHAAARRSRLSSNSSSTTRPDVRHYHTADAPRPRRRRLNERQGFTVAQFRIQRVTRCMAGYVATKNGPNPRNTP